MIVCTIVKLIFSSPPCINSIAPFLMLYCRYVPGPDDMLVLDIAYMIYLKFKEYPNALQIALFLDNLQVSTLITFI